MADEDQSRPERSIAELQRIAFGRADSPAEKARADDALRQLQQTEAKRTRAAQKTPARADVAVTDGEDVDDAINHDADSAIEGRSDNDGESDREANSDTRAASMLDRPLSSLPRWLLPVVAVGLIAVGAVTGFAAGDRSVANSSAGLTAEPSAIPSGLPADIRLYAVEEQSGPTDNPLLSPIQQDGDIDAAERWFADGQGVHDLMPMPMSSIDPTTTRLALRAPGVDPWDVWVAKGTGDFDYCLAVSHPESDMTESTCATVDNFASSGLALVTDSGVNVSWNGAEVTATRTR